MRIPVIAGNWKIYKTIARTVSFIEKMKPVAEEADHRTLPALAEWQLDTGHAIW